MVPLYALVVLICAAPNQCLTETVARGLERDNCELIAMTTRQKNPGLSGALCILEEKKV